MREHGIFGGHVWGDAQNASVGGVRSAPNFLGGKGCYEQNFAYYREKGKKPAEKKGVCYREFSSPFENHDEPSTCQPALDPPFSLP